MKVYVKIYESILFNPLLRIIVSLKCQWNKSILICAEVTKKHNYKKRIYTVQNFLVCANT